ALRVRRRAESSALVLVVDLGEFRIDDLLFGLAFGRARAFGLAPAGSLGLGLLRFVHRLAELHRRLGQRRGLLLHFVGITAFNGSLGVRDRGFDLRLDAGVDLVAMLGQLALGRVDQALGIVLRSDRGAPL